MDFCDLLTSLLPKAARWNSIGIQLGLSPDELATIKADSNDVQECLRKVLQKWYDRTPHPTWGQVITALRAPLLEEMKLAKELEHKMIISATPEKDQDMSTDIIKEIQTKIKGSFATLVRKVIAKLEENDLSIKDFRLYVLNLFPPGDIFVDLFTVRDIFEAISRHRLWDYAYCTPIEEIANEFGGDDLELRGWIDDYKSELAGFKATTRIMDYIKMSSDEKEIADSKQSLHQDMARYDGRYCRKLTIKLKSRVTERSLDYIDQFWRSIADHFLLPSLSALLDSIQEGCVEVTWLVPTLSALQIQANIQDSTAFLEKCEVIRVIMDGEILYDKGLGKKLLIACERGDADEVLALLTSGVAVDTTCTEEKQTPLLVAACVGNLDIVRMLLSHHAAIDQQDSDGYTPLIMASLHGHLSVVEILLAHNADHKVETKDGWTALASACCECHVKTAEVLLQHGAAPNVPETCWSPLMYAAYLEEENLSLVELLMDAGATVNNTLDVACPLSLACDRGHVNIVRLLISKGANVNIWGLNEEGFIWTPLMVAATKGRYQICQLLLEHGAVVGIPPEAKGEAATPLTMACRLGRMDVVNLLLEHGANVHARCKNGITAMHICCQEGHLDVVKVLQSHGASLGVTSKYLLDQMPSLLNTQTETGWSPLMIACDAGHSAVVAILLSHGADTELSTYQAGLSPLMLATNKGNLETVRLLLKAGAQVDLRNKSAGWTALFLAARKGHLAIAKALLENGADMSLKATDANVTAYDVASIHGQRGVCEELEAHGYQSSTPPAEDVRREVERSSVVVTQNFLDMENIHTFREVLRDRGRSGRQQTRFPHQRSSFDDIIEEPDMLTH